MTNEGRIAALTKALSDLLDGCDKLDPEQAILPRQQASARAALASTGSAERDVIAEIAAERRRQIEQEGWTAEHDDEHDAGELLNAALCYIQRWSDAQMFGCDPLMLPAPARWPWASSWWKPKDRRRDLIRAAALLVAEIERLDRLASREQAEARRDG